MDEQVPVIPENLVIEPQPGPAKRASFWQRFFALLIDLIVLGLIDGGINLLGLQNWSVGRNLGWWPALWSIVQGAIPAIYFIWSYSSGGQTLGKRAMMIKVISMDGSPLNLAVGILRTLGYLLSAALFYLGFLWSIWDVEKQAWHDKIAGTCVVPVAFVPAQLQGTHGQAELKAKRKRWLLGLGIPFLVIIGGVYIAIFALVDRGLAEIRDMGTWPGMDTSPEQAVKIDLTNLGLKLEQVLDARTQGNWANAQYDEGVVIRYTVESNLVVDITALRYADKQTASSDYHNIQAYAGQAGVCGSNVYAYNLNSGIIHCQFSDAYQKLLWNNNWIISITALEGGSSQPEVLVDQVRDDLAAHWASGGLP